VVMNFVILPSEQTMSVDNAALELDSTPWVPINVEIVAWNETKGFREYNDRPRVTEAIDDLENYQAPINAWINVASQVSPQLTLAQAKQIKSDFVEALFNVKRRRPFVYSYWFEATDEAVNHMSALVAMGLTSRVDEAITTMVGELNGNVNLSVYNANRVDTWSAQEQSNWIGLNISQYNVTTYGNTGPFYNIGVNPPDSAWATHGHPTQLSRLGHQLNKGVASGGLGLLSMSPVSSQSVASGGLSAVNWQPLYVAGQVQINFTVFKDALQGIINRRVTLAAVRDSKKSQIESQTMIAGVIAVDAVAGW
jgi:hypothetical protein